MIAIHLQVEYLSEPLGLGQVLPRFYWNGAEGKKQTAYQIVCRKENEVLWDSGKVPSSSMTHIPYQGKPLNSRDRVEWSVTLWDENDVQGEPQTSWFEMGLLLPEDWKAKWISGNYHAKKGIRYPVDCFRRAFQARGPVRKARLYASVRGLYDVTINGERLKDWLFAPGSTDYRKRIQYQTYDVTALIQKQNIIELRLADGWFRGCCAAYGVENVYGTETSLIAQLEMTYEDGTIQIIYTGKSWSWSNDGPIRFADLQDGEIYDASRKPSYNGKARVVKAPKVLLTAPDNVPVQEHEHFEGKVLTAKDGTQVLDFGQNLAGYPKLIIRGKKGQKVRMVLGEVLDQDGHTDLSGIQETRPAGGWTTMSMLKKLLTNQVKGEIDPTPRQEIVFTCTGGEDHYQPSFAVFGFRYLQIEGDAQVEGEAIAVYSSMEETGTFRCSSKEVNQLLHNTLWSMKSNFLDVPTDCPTRERLGWTGDAQIFFDTGAYLMDTAPFFAKWMRDMQDAQYKNGLLPAVLPYNGVEQMYKSTGSSAGWADAVYLIPYRYWKRFGDRRVLEQYWPMMKRFADYLLGKIEKDGHYEKGIHLGEWLEPEEFRDQVYGAKAKHPEECTAYLYLAMMTLTEIAKELGENAYAAELYGAAANAKAAYRKYAELDTDRQAKLVRPLALGLLDGETKRMTERRLVQAVENYAYCVGTGFLSTPFLLPVLTEAGETETAYKMLLNEKKPGWLGEVKDGATTVWENWEGNLSQNHYSPGAVCQWLFDTVLGIHVKGENHFIIRPIPGKALRFAEGSYKSLYGAVSSRWEQTEDGIRFTVEIPANTTADILLPDGRLEKKEAGRYEYVL